MKYGKTIFLLILVLLAGCGEDRSPLEYAAPELGAITIEAEAFRAWITCPVSGNLAGVSKYGVRFGSELLKEIPATLENGALKAEVRALSADTDYSVEVYLSNGAETLTGMSSFRTEKGPATVELPDPVFRRYILAHFDENGYGVLTEPEAMLIQEIEVCTDSIQTLQAIEKMGELVRLTASGSEGDWGRLSHIDLSGNPLLEYCNLNDNHIREIDLSQIPNLVDFQIASNPLSTIDFSANPHLSALYLNNIPFDNLPEMTFLPLRSLHIDHTSRFFPDNYLRHFPLMESLNMSYYEGRTIDFSQNAQLRALWAHGCPYLEELDLTATPRLVILYIDECPRLRRVYVRTGTEFEELEKDDHTELIYVE